MSQERAYWLAWSCIAGIGPVTLRRIEQQFGSLAVAWQAPADALGTVDGIGPKAITTINSGRSQIKPEQLLAQHERENPQFWTPGEVDYPRLLWEIPSPPPLLYYRGQVARSENQGITPMIGIVGTREPTDHGRRWTRRLSSLLARHGFTVVSGMAAGIDGEAHRSCLQQGGRTIAVMGTGVDMVYPPSHQTLYQAIQEQGLILSEYPAETAPDRSHFPARNRIIAGLCRAVIVIEAPQRSGALITARYANEFNRDVYTIPNSPEVQQSRGCLQLLQQGAEFILDEADFLEKLGTMPPLDPHQPPQQLSILPVTNPVPAATSPPLPDLTPDQVQVLTAIAPEPTSFDAIAQQSGLGTAELSGTLLHLELLGVIAQLPGMRYQRCL